MGTYKNKAYPLRVDENLMEKISKIAEKNSRTKNKQIEYILKLFVEEYEKSNGKISTGEINVSGDMHSYNANTISIGKIKNK